MRLGYPLEPGVQPASILRVYIKPKHIPASRAHEAPLAMNPQIYTDISGDELVINPQCLQAGEVKILINAVCNVLETI